MPSTTIPRSQTGLVPTSNKLQMNRMASPNNYRKLPPRPPPEKFPYRGDFKIRHPCRLQKEQQRKNRTAASAATRDTASTVAAPITNATTSIGQENDNIRRRRRSNKTKQNHVRHHRSRNDGINSFCRKKMRNGVGKASLCNDKQKIRKNTKKNWDLYTSEKEIHQFTKKEQQKRLTSESVSLTYIRDSAKHRTQLEELERRLDFEIDAENHLLGKYVSETVGSVGQQEHEQEQKAPSLSTNTDGSSSILTELKDFKDSILRMCEVDHEEVQNLDEEDFSQALPNQGSSRPVSTKTKCISENHLHRKECSQVNNDNDNDAEHDSSNDQMILRDYLSLQSDGSTSLATTGSLNMTHQIQSSSLSGGDNIDINHQLHEFESVGTSNDTSLLSEVGQISLHDTDPHHTTVVDGEEKLVSPNRSNVSTETICTEDYSEPSNKTLWDGLSDEQTQRIRKRMKELYASDSILDEKFTTDEVQKSLNMQLSTRQEQFSSLSTEESRVQISPIIIEGISIDRKSANTLGRASIKKNEVFFYQQVENGTQNASSLCVSNIISKISEDLCTSMIRVGATTKTLQEQSKPNLSNVSIRGSSAISALDGSIPKPLSKPRHPFALPLATDIKESIENGKRLKNE